MIHQIFSQKDSQLGRNLLKQNHNKIIFRQTIIYLLITRLICQGQVQSYLQPNFQYLHIFFPHKNNQKKLSLNLYKLPQQQLFEPGRPHFILRGLFCQLCGINILQWLRIKRQVYRHLKGKEDWQRDFSLNIMVYLFRTNRFMFRVCKQLDCKVFLDILVQV